MDEQSFNNTIYFISVFSTLAPITAGVIKYKIAGKYYRLFLLFLVYAFLTDFYAFLLHKKYIDTGMQSVYISSEIYSLVEAVFLFFFIMVTNESTFLKKICRLMIIAAIPAWGISFALFQKGTGDSELTPFCTTYYIIAAFLSGYALLKLAEKTISLRKEPLFWFLIAIYFFCFNTFIIIAISDTAFGKRFWYIHNIINTGCLLIFMIAFLSITKSRSSRVAV